MFDHGKRQHDIRQLQSPKEQFRPIWHQRQLEMCGDLLIDDSSENEIICPVHTFQCLTCIDSDGQLTRGPIILQKLNATIEQQANDLLPARDGFSQRSG